MPAQHLPREADHRDPSGVAHTSTKNPSALTFSLLRCMARAKTMREGAAGVGVGRGSYVRLMQS